MATIHVPITVSSENENTVEGLLSRLDTYQTQGKLMLFKSPIEKCILVIKIYDNTIHPEVRKIVGNLTSLGVGGWLIDRVPEELK